MTRLLCTGDQHIGSGADLGAPGERLAEQEACWRRVLELSREHDVDGILHAGDLWDKRKPTPDEYLAAERPLVEHKAAGGPPVVMINGNHCRSGVSEDMAVSVLAEAGLIHLSTRPEVIPLDGVAVCTLPWIPAHRIVAGHDENVSRDMVNAYAADLLVQAARDLRATVDGPAILLGHWSVSGSSLPSGLPVDQLREPVLPLPDLEAIGFDAIALGHIHKPQQFAIGVSPVFYVGSPMGLSFGEPGEHGVVLLEPDTATIAAREQGLMVAHFMEIESPRFVTLSIEDIVTGCPVEGCYVKVRVVESDFTDEIKAALPGLGARRVWVDVQHERTQRARAEQITDELTETEALAAYLDAIGVNGDVAPRLLDLAGGYLEKARA